jgi:tetraacyldisaccharide 4'-kinase
MGLRNQWKSLLGRLWLSASALHRRWRRPRAVRPLPVVVVGSLRSGGGGKTPAVFWLARNLPEAAVLVHPTPDEEPLLRGAFGRRVHSGRSFLRAWDAARRAGFPLAICDGGFQDPRLDGGTRLLLWNSPPPRGPGELLPCGPFRELAAAAGRADLVLVRQGISAPQGPMAAQGYRWNVRLPTGMAAGGCLLACGVGDPEGVRKDLERLGCTVLGEHVVGDHRNFSMRAIRHLSRSFPGIPWIGTGKDLPRWPSQAPHLHVLERDWVPQDPDALLDWIRRRTSAAVSATAPYE